MTHTVIVGKMKLFLMRISNGREGKGANICYDIASGNFSFLKPFRMLRKYQMTLLLL